MVIFVIIVLTLKMSVQTFVMLFQYTTIASKERNFVLVCFTHHFPNTKISRMFRSVSQLTKYPKHLDTTDVFKLRIKQLLIQLAQSWLSLAQFNYLLFRLEPRFKPFKAFLGCYGDKTVYVLSCIKSCQYPSRFVLDTT